MLATYCIEGLRVSEGASIGGTFHSGDVVVFSGGTLAQRYQLIQTLMGNQPLSHGAIIYNDKRLHDLDAVEKARLQNSDFAFFPGNDLLLDHLTLVENCLVSEQHVNGITIERAKILLRRLGFTRPEALYPDQLTLPKRKLVALARCLRKDPKVIFAYEPFRALAPDDIDVLWSDISRILTERHTILIVTAEKPIRAMAAEAITFSL